MAFEDFLKTVTLFDGTTTYTIPIWNLKVRSEPWHSSGQIMVQYFHGKHSTRVQGYRSTAEFEMVFSGDGIDDQEWSNMLNDLANDVEWVIDFDPENAGVRTETYVLADSAQTHAALISGKIRNRSTKTKWVSVSPLDTTPTWISACDPAPAPAEFKFAYLAHQGPVNKIEYTDLASPSALAIFADDDPGTTTTMKAMGIDIVNNVIYWSYFNGATQSIATRSYDPVTGASVGGISTIYTQTDIMLGIVVGTGVYAPFVYFSTGDNKIKRIDLDGTNLITIATGLNNPGDLDIDEVAGRVYSASTGIGRIEWVDITITAGSPTDFIITGSDFFHIQIDQGNDKIFVRGGGFAGRIKSGTFSTMDIDGNGLSTFHAETGTRFPGPARGTGAGSSSDRVYFLDTFVATKGLYSRNFAGADLQLELEISPAPITVFELRLG